MFDGEHHYILLLTSIEQVSALGSYMKVACTLKSAVFHGCTWLRIEAAVTVPGMIGPMLECSEGCYRLSEIAKDFFRVVRQSTS